MNMQFEINGFIFDGTTSKRSDAKISINPAEISLSIIGSDGESVIFKNPAITKISSRLGNSARYIEIENLGRFETKDNDRVDNLESLLFKNEKSKLVHKLESNLFLIIIALFVTIGFTGATIKWGIPALADHIVEVMPERTSDLIGTKILETLDKKVFQPSSLSDARQKELQNKFNLVLKKLGSSDKNYEFRFRNAEKSIGPNALAFPSGVIIMTDQLVELSDNDKQLMGILAHEIGHLDGQHSLRQLVRGSIITFLVAFISGDISGASSTLITAPVVLLELSYSRQFEVEADSYALAYFECDIEGLKAMAQFFNTLDESLFDDNVNDVSKDEVSNPNNELSGANNSNPVIQEDSNAIAEDKFIKDEIVEGPEGKPAEGKIEENKNDKSLLDFLSSHPASSDRADFFLNHIRTKCQ